MAHYLAHLQSWLQRYHVSLLVAILAFTFFTRVYRLETPSVYIFDEVYHALTAKLVARNDVQAFEWWNPPVEPDTAVDWLHPPLAKYTQAASMLVFGENSFGWRFSSVIFGVLVVWATYQLMYELFRSQVMSLAAALLAAFDGLLLVQSRIAMNDIHVTFFILLAMIVYLRYRRSLEQESSAVISKAASKSKRAVPTVVLHLGSSRTKWLLALTGLCAGLAMGSKWSGVFVLLLIVATEGVLTLQNLWTYWMQTTRASRPQKKTTVITVSPVQAVVMFSLRKIMLATLCLVVIPLTMYVASYAQMFLQGKSLLCFQQESIQGTCYYERFEKNGQVTFEGYLSHFGELHHQIFWYQTHLTATHPYQSRPWQWFLNLRPVWFHVNYDDLTQSANIYAFGNPALFWWGVVAVGLSIAAIVIAVGLKLTHHLFDSSFLSFSFLFLLAGYFIVWLPWQFSPRIMFFYHYTPAVPLLAILIVFWLRKLVRYHWLIPGVVVSSVAICFVLWYPHWTALPVSKEWADRVYFAIQSWR